jgi:hypothetical protein
VSDNTVIPFGKHKDTTIAEVMARDPAYIDWLVAQPWVRDRYPHIIQIIHSGGVIPDACTPEHNKMQMLLGDKAFAFATTQIVLNEVLPMLKYYEDKRTPQVIKNNAMPVVRVLFEDHGWDVRIDTEGPYNEACLSG